MAVQIRSVPPVPPKSKVIQFPVKAPVAVLQVEPEAPPIDYGDLSRAAVIKRIKQALKQRSGRQWSVTGGKGTAYGWIYIKAVKPHAMDEWGNMNDADRTLLGKLLGLDKPVHFQGESIPASNDYYREYIDRAEGRKPSKCGSPYWD